MERRLELEMLAQPDDFTCGPTALHAVYRYYDDDITLERVIAEIRPLETGGSLVVTLACHALRRGYRASINTYNLQLFDPTWFHGDVDLRERLTAQLRHKDDPKLHLASQAYLEFLSLGGRVAFEELTPELIAGHLRCDRPVLAGLSATYLYGCARELHDDADDVRGEPTGHFVVLCGYSEQARSVLVADPMGDNPRFGSGYYTVSMDRLLGAIMLGIVTYDANLLIVTTAGGAAEEPA